MRAAEALAVAALVIAAARRGPRRRRVSRRARGCWSRPTTRKRSSWSPTSGRVVRRRRRDLDLVVRAGRECAGHASTSAGRRRGGGCSRSRTSTSSIPTMRPAAGRRPAGCSPARRSPTCSPIRRTPIAWSRSVSPTASRPCSNRRTAARHSARCSIRHRAATSSRVSRSRNRIPASSTSRWPTRISIRSWLAPVTPARTGRSTTFRPISGWAWRGSSRWIRTTPTLSSCAGPPRRAARRSR